MAGTAAMWALRCGTLGALVAGLVAISPLAPLWGDGVEYAATSMAWINHASPDLRSPDIGAVHSGFTQAGYDGLHPNMLIASGGGAIYSLHFWFYSLLCAPAALVLRGMGFDPLIAFPVTNAIGVGVLAWLALFWSGPAARRDRVMIALAVITPVLAYLPFAHPEAFTWACVLASLVALNRHRYALAAVLAACGAMQNPPVTLLAGYCVVLAALDHGWRGALLPAAAAAFCLTPAVYSLLAFGHFNPIVQRGFIDRDLMTPARAWSFFTDLNQGLIVHVPGLVLLAMVSLLRRPTARALGMMVVLGVMIAIVSMNVIWNTALAGLIRYGVWMVPILAWLATESMPATRAFTAAVVLILVVHAALLLLPQSQAAHTRLAQYALDQRPAWYQPEPEIFVDRLLGVDEPWNARLPLAYRRADGTITKVLLDRTRVPELDRIFVVDPAYLVRVAAEAPLGPDVFYLDPPAGTVSSRCPSKGREANFFQRHVRADLVRVPATAAARRIDVLVQIANDGTNTLCNLGSGGSDPVNLTFRLFRADGALIADGGVRTRAPQLLGPGTAVSLPVTVVLPAEGGRYTAEIVPVLEGRTFGIPSARFAMDVVTGDGGRYSAVASPQS